MLREHEVVSSPHKRVEDRPAEGSCTFCKISTVPTIVYYKISPVEKSAYFYELQKIREGTEKIWMG